MPPLKPMLTVDQQIAHLEDKGVTFKLLTEEDARKYLSEKNNFLRVASYRECFDKQMQGEDAGKYLNLDFAYLADLASIDREVRETFLRLTLDIEHFAKVRLISIISNMNNEDGYGIVTEFLASLPTRYKNSLASDLRARSSAQSGDLYSGSLIAKHQETMPVWVLPEVMSFGMFLSFYRFCALRWNDQQVVVTLYACWTIVQSEDASRRAAGALQRLRARLFEHRRYYSKNDALMSSFSSAELLTFGFRCHKIMAHRKSPRAFARERPFAVSPYFYR
jgi:abortive infection bacteriophage resistance protein